MSSSGLAGVLIFGSLDRKNSFFFKSQLQLSQQDTITITATATPTPIAISLGPQDLSHKPQKQPELELKATITAFIYSNIHFKK